MQSSKSAEIYSLTTEAMKKADKEGLKELFDCMKGDEKKLMLKALREQKWGLCTKVFEFAAYRYFQKKVEAK